MNKLFLAFVAAVSVSAVSAKDLVKKVTLKNETGVAIVIEDGNWRGGRKATAPLHYSRNIVSDYALQAGESVTITVEAHSDRIRLQDLKVSFDGTTVIFEFANESVKFNVHDAREIIIRKDANGNLKFFVVTEDGKEEELEVVSSKVLVKKSAAVAAVVAAQQAE